ncbi:hypothetical protein PT974_01848 [Cladobotryum mycophilum]|uniref:Chromo domain-containing protein n=1 Tax=Cladobotryum mycophilum TaxID=491253 RepID=A0ABR0SWJ8_9HYPO
MTAAATVSSDQFSLASDPLTPCIELEGSLERFGHYSEEDFVEMLTNVATATPDDIIVDEQDIEFTSSPDDKETSPSLFSDTSVYSSENATTPGTTKSSSDMNEVPPRVVARTPEAFDDSDSASEPRRACSIPDDKTESTSVDSEREAIVNSVSRPEPVAVATPTKKSNEKGEESNEAMLDSDEPTEEPDKPEEPKEDLAKSTDEVESSNNHEGAEAKEIAIEEFQNHRVDKKFSLVDIQVRWENNEITWESEYFLQCEVPKLVYDYWAERGGRQTATGLDEYHVFKLLKRRRIPPSYLVQWVGYRATAADTTWESKKLLQKISPKLLEDFESDLASKSSAPSKKRGIARSTGRPSKKLKIASEVEPEVA